MPTSPDHIRPLKRVTENQLRRRSNILSSARELLSKHGYKGVTMRLLADHSGVALKTLYDYYKNKDDLLREAIDDRYALIYGMIEEDTIRYGFNRLLFIAESIVGAMFTDKRFAKEMLRLRQVAGYGSRYDATRLQSYKRAINEIGQQGDLKDWVDVEFLTPLLTRQAGLAMLSWADGRISDNVLEPYFKLNICTVLDGLTEGETNKQITVLEKQLHQQLRTVRL